jgi:hypothetical protein
VPRAAIEGALAKVRGLDGVALVASPFARGGQVSQDGRLASVDVRYLFCSRTCWTRLIGGRPSAAVCGRLRL